MAVAGLPGGSGPEALAELADLRGGPAGEFGQEVHLGTGASGVVRVSGLAEVLDQLLTGAGEGARQVRENGQGNDVVERELPGVADVERRGYLGHRAGLASDIPSVLDSTSARDTRGDEAGQVGWYLAVLDRGKYLVQVVRQVGGPGGDQDQRRQALGRGPEELG